MPHKDPVKNKEYRSTDQYRAKAAARTKVWREKNPDGHRRWVENNKSHRLQYMKDYDANNRPQRRKLHDDWVKKNPERASQLLTKSQLKKFGLTIEDYERLLASQNGVCAICHGPPNDGRKRLAVDHDHTTGEVRGLLCNSCNLTLGQAKDSEERLLAAAAYLRRHRAPGKVPL
jgi:recombination endonuclease VII